MAIQAQSTHFDPMGEGESKYSERTSAKGLQMPAEKEPYIAHCLLPSNHLLTTFMAPT